MILTTSTANIRRWLVICDVCKIQLEAFSSANAPIMDREHAKLHGVAA